MTEMLSTLRHSRRSVWLLSAVVVVLVGGFVLSAINGFAGPAHNTSTIIGTGHGGVAKANRSELIVHGSSPADLAPGVTKTVNIRIRNPHHSPIVISTASIKVGNASKACTAAKNISTSSYRSTAPGAKTYTVSLHHRVKIPLKLTMLDLPTNQDACKGAKFPLTYNATGRKG